MIHYVSNAVWTTFLIFNLLLLRQVTIISKITMPSIDFYFISTTAPEARFRFACRLLEKAYKQKHQIYTLVEDAEKAQLLDRLLWTFRDESFVPHQCIALSQTITAPIQISHQAQQAPHQDILLNLQSPAPHFHGQFNRILEIITPAPDLQQAAEEHRVFYEEKGYKITSHQIN